MGKAPEGPWGRAMWAVNMLAGFLQPLPLFSKRLQPGTQTVTADIEFPQGTSSATTESTVVVICFKDVKVFDSYSGKRTTTTTATVDIGFLIQGEPGCVFTAASNITGVKEALTRRRSGSTINRTCKIYVMTSANYAAYVKMLLPGQPMVYNTAHFSNFGAKEVLEVQTEVRDSEEIVGKFTEILDQRPCTYPAAEDGIAILHFEGDLAGAGPGFRLAEAPIKSYPASQGFAIGARYLLRNSELAGDKVLCALRFEEATGQLYPNAVPRMSMPFQCPSDFIGGPVFMPKSSLYRPSDLEKSPRERPNAQGEDYNVVLLGMMLGEGNVLAEGFLGDIVSKIPRPPWQRKVGTILRRLGTRDLKRIKEAPKRQLPGDWLYRLAVCRAHCAVPASTMCRARLHRPVRVTWLRP